MIKSGSITNQQYYIETENQILVGYGNIRMTVEYCAGIFDSYTPVPYKTLPQWFSEFYEMHIKINSNVPGTLCLTVSRLSDAQNVCDFDDFNFGFPDLYRFDESHKPIYTTTDYLNACMLNNLVPVYDVYIYSNNSK